MKKNTIQKIAYLTIPVVILVFVFVALHFAKEEPKEETNLPYTVTYSAEKGGSIEGQKIQRIEKGNSTSFVSAIPDEGYYFVQWSDGRTTPQRQETEVQNTLRLTAEFAKITDGIKIEYQAGYMGYIQGKQEQTVQKGTESWTVTAKPFDDALFIKWTDGVTTPTRQDQNITEPFTVKAEFGYTITYTTSGEGQLKGKTEQTLPYGEISETITAVPDIGYTFIGWSDGSTNPTRQDSATTYKELTAYFEWKEEYEFQYNYNYATDNCSERSIHLKRGETKGKTINVPIRDHFHFCGWYLDETYTEQATDETGKIILDEIFDQPSRELYAKWEVKKEDIVTYKILMVYVTAIDANLMGNDHTMVELHYRMNDEERQMCNEITEQFAYILNDMLDGLVRFEIDSYFTTQSISEEHFSNEAYSTYTSAELIPELINSGILDDYRSVITTYSCGKNDNLLPNWAGTANVKYAKIPFDNQGGELGNEYLAYYPNLSKAYSFSVYVHEFIHTMEQGITCYEYHEANSPIFTNFIRDKLYLLNQWTPSLSNIEKEDRYDLYDLWLAGEKVGIPYSFWKNEICTVTIQVESLNGETNPHSSGLSIHYYYNEEVEFDWWSAHTTGIYNQKVPKGSRTSYLWAEVIWNGYRFVGWSDGCSDPVRILTDVQEDITLIAYYERLPYTINYQATEGGHIEGETSQTTLLGEYYDKVYAVAEEGYQFVGWSDGKNSNSRMDISGGKHYNVETEQWENIPEDFTVTAIFEKIEDTEN